MRDQDVVLPEYGQEVIFTKSAFRYGAKIPLATVYVDQISGEEMEKFILMDRQKISEEGIMIVVVEIEGETGKVVSKPDIIARGFVFPEKDGFVKQLNEELLLELNQKSPKSSNMGVYRKIIQRTSENLLYRMKREPLVIPIVIEV
jgi:ribonuclease J